MNEDLKGKVVSAVYRCCSCKRVLRLHFRIEQEGVFFTQAPHCAKCIGKTGAMAMVEWYTLVDPPEQPVLEPSNIPI